MKKFRSTIIILLIGINTTFGQQLQNKDDTKKYVITVFNSFFSNSSATYISALYDKPTFKQNALDIEKIKDLTPTQNKFLDSLIEIEYLKYINQEKENFVRIQKELRELNISFSSIKVDSVSIDNNLENNKYFKGTLYFRMSDNSEFYKMIFKGAYSSNNKVLLEKMFVPHKNPGPKNRILTSNLKQEYIDNCTKLAEQFILKFKNNALLLAIFNNCHKCYCERKYQSETDRIDGVERIKKPDYGFYLPK